VLKEKSHREQVSMVSLVTHIMDQQAIHRIDLMHSNLRLHHGVTLKLETLSFVDSMMIQHNGEHTMTNQWLNGYTTP